MLSEHGWFSIVKMRNYDAVIENVKEYHRTTDEYGNTGLMMALQANDLSMIDILAPHEYGISNPDGYTALVQAIHARNIEAVRILAKYESRFKTPDGMAPIHLAVHLENSTLIAILLPYSGAEVNIYNQNALEYAATCGKTNAAFYLLSDPHIYGPDDVRSAIALATNSGYPDMAKKLTNWLKSYNDTMSMSGRSTRTDRSCAAGSLQNSASHNMSSTLHDSVSRELPRSMMTSGRNLYGSTGSASSSRPVSGLNSSYGSTAERNPASVNNFALTPNYQISNMSPRTKSPGTGKYSKPATANAFEYLQFKKTLNEVMTRPASPTGSRSNSRSNSRGLGSTGNRSLSRGTGKMPASFSNSSLLTNMNMGVTRSRSSSRGRAGTPSSRHTMRGNRFSNENDPNFCSIYDTRTLTNRSPTLAFGGNFGGTADSSYNYVEHLPDKIQTHALYGPITGYDPQTVNYTVMGDVVPRNIVTDPIIVQYSRPDLTDLMVAAKVGRTQLVKEKASEQFLKRSKNGRTALMYAAQRNFVEMVIILAEYETGASDNLGYSALMYAASLGHLESLEVLLTAESGQRRHTDGATALMAAAANGHLNCVQKLAPFEAGIRSRNGTTALMLAIKYNHKECAYFLMKHEVKGYDDTATAVEQFCQEYGREEYIVDLRSHLRAV